MRRFVLSLGLILFLAPLATAQPAESEEEGKDEQPTTESSKDELTKWANNLDRPLARALAYERRDVVADMLASPTSLEASSAKVLAEDVGIPHKHAETLINAARSGTSLKTMHSLLKTGLPPGSAARELKLPTVGEAELRAAGMSKAEVTEFLRFRNSAKRVYHHFREVRAINEARARGAEVASERARAFRKASMPERIKMIARGLGLSVGESASPEAVARAERARLHKDVMKGREAGYRDVFASYRRTDGTINWGRFSKSEFARGAGNLVHFAFALFLKELAIVLKTGDRSRLEEFVDGLFSTDFFVNYGLFAAGASMADVMYGRYVRRLTRKRFMSGVLRSNIVLAAGLAVPMVVRGQFSLDTYLVDVAALGLSVTAVKAAAEGAKGVYRLVRGGKTAINLGRLAGPVGWVYTAGETAVVLLLGDYLANTFDRWLSKSKLKKQIKWAEERLNELLGRVGRGERVPEEEIARAVESVELAYDDMRRYKANPLEHRLAEFRTDLDEASRRALRDETAVDALERRLKNNPALRRHFAKKYGSTKKFVERMRSRREGLLERDLTEAGKEFEEDWERILPEVYEGETTPHDPAPAPGSRLSLYDEETTLLLRALDGTTDPVARRHIALAIERVRLARAIDKTVYSSGSATNGEAPPPTPEPPPVTGGNSSPGLTGSLPE